MAFWKDNTVPRQPATPAPEAREPAPLAALSKPEPTPPPPPAAPSRPVAAASPVAAPVARPEPGLPRKESLIAADITIEGKIEGGGSVRIAGKFKGDVNVQGDLTIEAGAKLTGGVRADKVTIAGELEGNVEESLARRPAADRRGDRRPQGRLADGRGRRPHARPGRVRLGRRQGLECRQAQQRRGERHRLMSSVRPGSPGATRECPHCRETILESAAVCPACRHYLRFDAGADARRRSPRSRRCASKAASGIPPTANPGNTRSSCRFATIAAKKSRHKLVGVGAHEPERAAHLHAVGRSRVRQGEGPRQRRHRGTERKARPPMPRITS